MSACRLMHRMRSMKACFRDHDDSLLGVVISHPHRDHYGLVRHIRPEVSLYIGEDAHNILKAASAYIPNGHAFTSPRFIKHREQLEIGPFRITPYLVDHSAFDAYALLVEADGKRVYYSGDFRAHGRKNKLFESMIKCPLRGIDVLLMEGTTIGRAGTSKGFATEADLEQEFVQAFKETKGIHFVWTSAQNIDRMVTIFRAARRAGRTLVIDLYTAVILEATGKNGIPQSVWHGVKLYIPHHQRLFIKKKGLFDDLGRHKTNRIFQDHLADLSAQAVMLFRPVMMRDKGINVVLEGAKLSYSMWEGYLKQESTQRARTWLEEKNIPMQVIHTSGHASTVDLKRFADALSPRRLVPIHSFETGRFAEFFDNVVQQALPINDAELTELTNHLHVDLQVSRAKLKEVKDLNGWDLEQHSRQ